MRPPRVAHALGREGEEAVRGGATPLRITGRKVRADVALGERAQNGIDQRMQTHIRIGMSGEAAVMRDADAAEHQVIAGTERMDVEPVAGTQVGNRREPVLRAGQVVRRGELHVARFTLECRHRQAGPFGERGVIGKIVASGGGSATMRIQNWGIAECLRRLHRPQCVARERCGHPAGGIDRLDGIGNCERRDRRPCLRGGHNGAGDEGRRGKGARPVVHQHDVGPRGIAALPARRAPRLAGWRRRSRPAASR